MTIAGFYDGSCGWAWHVDLPAKSGVGGGILAVVPWKGRNPPMFAPTTDEAGNSVKAQEVIEYVTNKLNQPLFAGLGWMEMSLYTTRIAKQRVRRESILC